MKRILYTFVCLWRLLQCIKQEIQNGTGREWSARSITYSVYTTKLKICKKMMMQNDDLEINISKIKPNVVHKEHSFTTRCDAGYAKFSIVRFVSIALRLPTRHIQNKTIFVIVTASTWADDIRGGSSEDTSLGGGGGGWGNDPSNKYLLINIKNIKLLKNKYFLINILVQMRLNFHLHFLTWFENTSDNTKHYMDKKGTMDVGDVHDKVKERIFISNIDMNAQHKSSFYKFVGGPEGGGQKQVWPPKSQLEGGGHGSFGPSPRSAPRRHPKV